MVPGVLELGGGLLLDAEDDGVGAADADGGVALADGLEAAVAAVAAGGMQEEEAVCGRGWGLWTRCRAVLVSSFRVEHAA